MPKLVMTRTPVGVAKSRGDVGAIESADGGQCLAVDLEGAVPGVWVKVMSWATDPTAPHAHAEIKSMEGKPVTVTIEW